MFGKQFLLSVWSDEMRAAVASCFWQPQPTVKLTVWRVHKHTDPHHLIHWQDGWNCQNLSPCSDSESSDFHIRKQISASIGEEVMGSHIPLWPSMFKLKDSVPKFTVLVCKKKSILQHQRHALEAQTAFLGHILWLSNPKMHCNKLRGESQENGEAKI